MALRKLGSLAVLGWLSALLLGSCGSSEQKAAPLTGNLPLTAPATIQAGESATIKIGPVAAPDGTAVKLVATGSYGPRFYQAAFQQGVAQIELAAKDTAVAGLVTLEARADQAFGTGSFTAQAGPPVEPLTPMVGARAIIADSQHWSMVVVVPADRFGNPVAAGTPIQLQALHPNDYLEEQNLTVHNLVAWTRIFSTTRAGRTNIAVNSATAHGPAALLLEVAGWPVSFSLSAQPPSLPADGRQLMTVSSSLIRDKFGNLVPDGTLVTFTVNASSSQPERLLPAYTLSGVASISLQAPAEPSHYTIKANVYGVESRPLAVTFSAGPAIGEIPLTVQKDTTAHTIRLRAGPLLGPLGQYVADGIPVQFQLTSSEGQVLHFSATVESGYARLEIPLANLNLGGYQAEVTAGSGQGKLSFSLP